MKFLKKQNLESLKRKRLWIYPLIFAGIILFSLAIEVFAFNYQTLFLNESNKGIFDVKNYTVGTSDVKITYKGYINDLIITTAPTKRAEYTLSYNIKQPNGTFLTKVQEGSIFPEIPQEFIHIGGNYTDFVLKVDNNVINIKAIQVDNILTLSFHRFIFFVLFFSSLATLFIFRKLIFKRVEIGFLITAVFVGFAFAYLIPVNVGIVWDDETHFPRIHALLSIPVEKGVSLATYEIYSFKWAIFEDNTYKHKFYNEVDELKYYAVLNQNDKIPTSYTLMGLRAKLQFTGYLAPAIGLDLGRLLNLSFTTQFIMGRLSNLLIYLGAVFYAIKRSKRFKLSLAVMGLLPTAMFLASSYSYDPTTTGFLILGTVLIINELISPDDPIRNRDILIILFSFFIAVFHKMVYFPFFFLFFLIPSKKFKSKKIYRLSLVLDILLVLSIIAAFILPLLVFPSGVIGDVRGGNVNAVGQVKFILTNIPMYTGILLQNMKDVFVNYLFQYPYANMAYLGLADTLVRFVLMMMVTVVMIFDNGETEDKKYSELGTKNWMISAVILVFTVALVWTSMYIVFTPVGNTYIAGVQGRYFFPLFALAIFLLKPIKFYKVKVSMPNFGYLFFVSYSVLMFILIYPIIVARFWS